MIVPSDRHSAVAAEVVKKSVFLRVSMLYDAQTVILMREHGIKKIYMWDIDFHRFFFLEPVDPTV